MISSTQGMMRYPSHTLSPSMGSLGDGLSTASTATQITGLGVAGMQTAITSGLLTAAWATAAVPIIGAVVAAVAVIITLLHARKKPGQKVATTHIVDDVEPHLAANRDGYFSGPRTLASQVVALANFDAGFKYVAENCGVEAMGEPGSWCIEDRLPYGRTYTLPSSPTLPGGKTWIGNGKWNWYAYYRDPIANDTPNPDPPDPGTGDTYVVGTDPATGKPLYATSTVKTQSLVVSGLLLGAALLLTLGGGGGRRTHG